MLFVMLIILYYKYLIRLLNDAFPAHSHQVLPKAVASLSLQHFPLFQHTTTADLLPAIALCSVT